MKTYQYKVVSSVLFDLSEYEMEKQLNELGKEGWQFAYKTATSIVFIREARV